MFLQACVCPQGGVPDQVHPPGQVHPQTRYTPLDQVHSPQTRYTPGTRNTPRDQLHPPGTRYTPRTRYTPLIRYTPQTRYTPQDQVHPPGTRYTPLGPGTPPGTRYTPRDTATAADGTHPTGMHSCFKIILDYLRSPIHDRKSLVINYPIVVRCNIMDMDMMYPKKSHKNIL